MTRLEIGGVYQWIITRGKNENNPILLLLSGGPGGTETGRFLKFNDALEDHFVVVNWEQRGCEKSYSAIKDIDSFTLEQYVSDIHDLTEYLKDRFNKDKIYILGHSWGSIIGTLAVKEKPENYHAYIGAAQMINIEETDKYMYEFVLEASKKYGDDKLEKELMENGPPPYKDGDILKRYKPFLTTYAQLYKRENPFNEKNTEWYSLSSMLMVSEFSWLDRIKVLLGLLNTFKIMYPEFQHIDFVEQANKLEIPVYYIIGKHDYTARFIQEYFDILEAPEKNLYFFENSAHGEI